LEQLKVLWKEYGVQDYGIAKDLVNERWELKGLAGVEAIALISLPTWVKSPSARFPWCCSTSPEPLLLSEL
jgi:hypothetical protein